ncbi:Shedu immune nuclease family protein [Agromyces badenianii]|uniref:Shedu immune nuclease family protein n=1 Tax=Agromyces badenianii TaxID=2080742 RepID=UPI000D59EAC3|nr:Shedu immune nuclease family protein [Agromyces badenianii]PWC03553.1 DUF4263 domain-containing protein [Agromyces badenianii]
MARFDRDRPDNGTLEFTADVDGVVAQFMFRPTVNALRLARLPLGTDPMELLVIDRQRGVLRIHPLNTLPIPNRFMTPKYPQVRTIEVSIPAEYLDDEALFLEDENPTRHGYAPDLDVLLEGLPRGLTKDFQYGLGLPKDYRFIVSAVEATTSCTEIVISDSDATHVDATRFIFSAADFESIRAELDRISARASMASTRVRTAFAHNAVAPHAGAPEMSITRGRHPIAVLLSDAANGVERLDGEQQDELLAATLEESTAIAAERPQVLTKLRNDIELVALDSLINSFESALGREPSEAYWQQFFTANQFALHLAFGYPIVSVESQASVGGRRIDGGGDKIADFMVKSHSTSNVGLFEIKKPGTPLLRRRAYRDGIYGPSQELSGSINQVLDQRYQLEKQFVSMKDASRLYDLEAYAVRCCLIIGITPSDPDPRKSFELFRHNSKNVDIITFDELLTKLRQLRGAIDESATTV